MQTVTDSISGRIALVRKNGQFLVVRRTDAKTLDAWDDNGLSDAMDRFDRWAEKIN